MFIYNLPRDLAKIDHVVEQKLDQEKKELYTKYIDMYNITRKFIIEKNLILYGGLALNLSLPKSKKFYNTYELPDYDFFSFSAKKHARELADIYHAKGYKYIEVKPGIHYETFKVYVDFKPVADITDIPKRVFNSLLEQSQKEKPAIILNNPQLDMNIAPLAFLRLAIHIELSRPDGYIERWPKIYERMTLFYNTYPLEYNECPEIFADEPSARVSHLVNKALTFIKAKGHPILGSEALKLYLKAGNVHVPNNSTLDVKMSPIEVISTEYKYTTIALKNYLSSFIQEGETLDIEKHSPLNKSEFIPKHYIIRLISKKEKRIILTVYKSLACYSYKTMDGFNLLTTDSALSLMYAYLFTNRAYYNKDKIKCAINILLNLQNKHLYSNKHIWSPFELKCYGVQPKIEDMKRHNWDKRTKSLVYRPSGKTQSKRS